MRIAVRLGGHTLPWQFRDGDRLGDWIASRPWHVRSEVRIVRLARAGAVTAVFDAVQQSAVGADQGTTDVHCLRLSPQQIVELGFETALARRLGVSIGADRYAMLQAVARRLADRPCLCLVPPFEADTPRAAQDAAECVDLLAKMAVGGRACVLMADTRDRPMAGPVFDFTVGGPRVEVGLSADAPDTLWARYLHIRLGWETAGEPWRAEEILKAVEPLSPGDDVALERGLNCYARAEHTGLSKAVGRQVEICVEAAAGGLRVGAHAVETTARELAASGLYWRPGGPNHLAPAPWLARGLLLGRSAATRPEFLRGCLVCAPLAQDLLMVCFQLEARERGRLIDLDDADANPEAKEDWDRFQQGNSLTYRLYPAGCPASPGGPWAFASFGTVLRRFKENSRQDDRYRLLRLRNHLAHGHYVSWEAVRELMDIRRLLTLEMI